MKTIVLPRTKNGPSKGSTLYADWKNCHLRMAVMCEDIELIERLITYGIDGHGLVNLRAFDNLALRIAKYYEKNKVIEFIEKRCVR